MVITETPQETITPRSPFSDSDRDAAVRRGLELMLVRENPWRLTGRVEERIERMLESHDRCGHDAFYRAFEHQCHAPSYQWAFLPCHATGHERCCWSHAVYELQKQWGDNFWRHYGSQPMALVEFRATGLGPRQLRKSVSSTLKSRPLRRLLSQTIGYLTPTADGYVWRQLCRLTDLDLLSEAQRAWEELVGEGASVTSLPVQRYPNARNIAAELRCQAEQALPLLVDSGSLEPQQALHWMAEELGRNRVVFGPGFRKLPPSPEPEQDAA